MPSRDDVPQTVGEAARAGWEWLRVRCVYCRRRARIPLACRPEAELLASLAAHVRCRRCPGLERAVDCALGSPTSVREKEIAFEAGRARRLGMR
jgi:hypothetical protein